MLVQARKLVDRIVLAISIPLTILMLGAVVWQVIARYLLSMSTSYADELSRYLFIWISLLGSAYILGKRGHIAITLVVDWLSPGAKRWMEVFTCFLVAVFGLLVLGYGGWLLVQKTITTGQISPAMQLPVGYFYAVIPLSGVLTVFYSFILIIETLKGAPLESNQVSLD